MQAPQGGAEGGPASLPSSGPGVTYPLSDPSMHSPRGQGHPTATDITGCRAGIRVSPHHRYLPLIFWGTLHDMRELSSLTRDQTHTPALGGPSEQPAGPQRWLQ